MPSKADIARSVISPASLAVTATKGTRKPWVIARHLRYIDRAIVECVTGRAPPILIIETPPRHGKSELISHWLPTWYLGVYPQNQVLLVSATKELAAKWSYKCRNTYTRVGPELFGINVAKDRLPAADWSTAEGGGLKAAGVGSNIIGRDGNLMILDDYLASSEDAFSEAIRRKQWEWWHGDFFSRVEPGVALIVIATRWHEEDIIGKLIAERKDGKGVPLRRIHLPAMAEENDELGREVGEALWPERWPLGTEDAMPINAWGKAVVSLAMRKHDILPYMWDAQFQQNPTGHGEAIFPPHYFKDIMVHPDDMPDAYESSGVALDPSMGASTKKGDYSCIATIGLSGGTIWITTDLERRPPTKIANDLIDTYNDVQPDAIGIESNNAQALFMNECDTACKERNMLPMPLVGINNHENKELRIGRLGSYLSRGKMRIQDDDGGRLLLRQLKEFPNGDHDDGPDALEMAIRLLSHYLGGEGDE